MLTTRKLGGPALALFGVALLAGLLYDATAFTTALGLEVTSEALVALAGLAVAAAAIGGGLWLSRKPPSPAAGR